MSKRIRTTTVEVHEYTLVHHLEGIDRATCSSCGSGVSMVTPGEAAAICDVSVRTIFRWVEQGRLHFSESQTNVWVCIRSLPVNVAPCYELKE